MRQNRVFLTSWVFILLLMKTVTAGGSGRTDTDEELSKIKSTTVPTFYTEEDLPELKDPEKITTGFHLGGRKKKLHEFPPEIFKYTNIRELSASRNEIKTIPIEIRNLRRLKVLELLGNEISDLTPLKGMMSLESLDVGGNKITSIKPISELSLKYLNLTNNPLQDIDTDIRRMTSLENIGLGEIALRRIPEGVCELPNLQTLDARSHELEVIDLCFKSSKFKNLHIGGTRTRKVKVLSVNIESLSVRGGGQIAELPPEMSKLAKLRNLDIQGNKIRKIYAFNKQIEDIRLSFNLVEELPDLCPLQKLQQISLKHNSLKQLPLNGGNCLPALQMIDLRENPDLVIGPEWFSLPNLETILLDRVTLVRSGIREDSEVFKKYRSKIHLEN